MTYSEHELSVVALVAIIAVVVAVFVLRSGGNLTPNIVTQTRYNPCVCNVQCAVCSVQKEWRYEDGDMRMEI